MNDHSPEYKAYINSFAWAQRRSIAITRAGWKCQCCGKGADETRLEVHHNHYRSLGFEQDEDLLVVCPGCHKVQDREREQRTSVRKINRRVDAWASKKYGEDWQESHDPDVVEEAFYEWLERKGESW